MMTITTYLKEVPGKGLGIFSEENIKFGDTVYEDDNALSKIFKGVDVYMMSVLQQDFVKKYATYKKDTDTWYLCLDNARFWNHSDTPNTKYIMHGDGIGAMVATMDIPAGTELTSDYREFCDECKEGNFDFKVVN